MIATTLEQSRKLVELGIDTSTADMFYIYDFMVDDINGIGIITENFKPEEKDIPAWSLESLLELLDDTITTKDGYDYFLHIYKENGQYFLSYHDRWNYGEDIETDYYDNMIDACFEIIVKLKENKYI